MKEYPSDDGPIYATDGGVDLSASITTPALSIPRVPFEFDPVLRRQDQLTTTTPLRTKTVRRRVLERAADLVDGDRDKEYGSPAVNLRRIADFWSVLFPDHPWTPNDVARAMIAVKLARSVQGHSEDTLIDIAGYAAIGAEVSA